MKRGFFIFKHMSKKLDEKFSKLDSSAQVLLKLRHTSEHVLHAAMQNLFPQLKKAMGPATDEGFYFDFDLDQKISEDLFPEIEKEMQKIINTKAKMVHENITPEAAKKLFSKNPYKLEWLSDIQKRGESVSIFRMIDPSGDEIDVDLCSGPHLDSVDQIKAFKLLTVAGAYWHGDEKNKMLTRIYGTCWPTQRELDEYLNRLEEAKRRDHRIIGKDLNLFVFSDLVGKGLPLLTSKGATIRRELERFVVDEELKRGYQHVVTPPLAKTELYKTSGHYPYYKDTMYPVMKVDEEELILRPMTCPHHFMLYKSSGHSYKELPIRMAELSPQFRYEKSGELTGLMRVRMFSLADAHIFATKDQAKQVISEVLDLIQFANEIFGMTKGEDYRYRLSLGDRKDDKKYFKDDAAWDLAEDVLREVLTERHEPFFEAPGEAAFYGPKIDVQVKKISGHEETAFTVQYDFVMPKRFDLKYTDNEGKEAQPIVIHRSSIGAFERTMAFLIEKYAGAFPTWLSPIQAIVIPISDKHLDYANGLYDQLKKQGIRVELNDKNEPLNARIRDAEMQKIPYILVVGDREAEQNTVSVRSRSQKGQNVVPVSEFVEKIKSEIFNKALA